MIGRSLAAARLASFFFSFINVSGHWGMTVRDPGLGRGVTVWTEGAAGGGCVGGGAQ